MSFQPKNRSSIRRVLILVVLSLGLVLSAFAQNEQAIYNFTGISDPAPFLTADSVGNLYGVLWVQGTVFQLSPSAGDAWTYTALGQAPGDVTSLAVDKSGNVFGTTSTGGIVTPICPQGCGTVFELSDSGGSWQETTILQFAQGAGNKIAPNPVGITIAKNGVLYAATTYAGGFGAVYALVPQSGGARKLILVYRFQGGSDGEYPNGSFAIDDQGDLYGTTKAGGNENGNCYDGSGFTTCGTVFELTPRRHPAAAHGLRILCTSSMVLP